MQIDRGPTVTERTGIPKPTRYAEIKKGTFPPGVKLYGARGVGWIREEYEAVIRARIAGKTDDEVRALVSELIKKRTEKEVA